MLWCVEISSSVIIISSYELKLQINTLCLVRLRSSLCLHRFFCVVNDKGLGAIKCEYIDRVEY
jgi:hypothetical protein